MHSPLVGTPIRIYLAPTLTQDASESLMYRLVLTAALSFAFCVCGRFMGAMRAVAPLPAISGHAKQQMCCYENTLKH